jgi:integrase
MAIFTLLYYTGIRRGDLAELRMQDIDWEKDLITIVQGKTGRTNTLPLLPAVGNSILDYVENERPKSDSRYLFLSTNRIPGRLSGGSIYDIVEKVLCCAGVRVDGGRKGTHLLRHNLSVSLLKNGTSTPMITEILGHSSPESVNAYLESDEAALKSCALSVADYPIRKEVFEVCLL